MVQSHLLSIFSLGLYLDLPALIHAYPRGFPSPFLASPLTTRDMKPSDWNLPWAVIGDSWGSGVAYGLGNSYDGLCHRYKHAWGPVISSKFDEWNKGRGGQEFMFGACSGHRLEMMGNEMDHLARRPELVIMEAGGNNAEFYPMADACLFNSELEDFPPTDWNNIKFPKRKDYGPEYPYPNGECVKGLNQVQDTIGKDGSKIKDKVIETIHMWRGHAKTQHMDAMLVVIGYGRFFAEGTECNDWSFALPWARNKPKLHIEMRKQMNNLIDQVNQGIREAAESFGDDKIRYVDINPAFNDHRFCEPGHTLQDQLNFIDNGKVWIWNRPIPTFATLKKKIGSANVASAAEGDVKAAADAEAETTVFKLWEDTDDNNNFPQPDDEINQLLSDTDIGDQDLSIIDAGDGSKKIKVVLDKNNGNQDTTLELEFDVSTPTTHSEILKKRQSSDLDSEGFLARTLHPTKDADEHMGTILVDWLKQNWTPNDLSKSKHQDGKLPQDRALSIILQANRYTTDGGQRAVDYSWAVFNTKRGQSAVCGHLNEHGADIHGILADQNTIARRDDLMSNPPFPEGTLRFQFDGEWCQYKQVAKNSSGPGKLFCYSLPDEGVQCEEDPAKGDPNASTDCLENGEVAFEHHPVVMCHW